MSERGTTNVTPVGPPISILKQAPADGHALAAAAKKGDFGTSNLRLQHKPT